ncbi:MAG: hypothetical protein BGO76_06345 [Caedibacter sp. 38-128]|nr:MAG: hypothetical protein BGO76_06345 [Caedibacter sp. 38-128]
MIAQNTNKIKRQKIALTSLAFLMLGSSSLKASDTFDDDLVKKTPYTVLHQETQKDQQYNIVGVALFSGTDPISSLIKVVTRSKISHVGIILADANDENKWYCFESTGSASEVLQGKYPHVRTTAWDKVVTEYDGKISYRLLVFEDRDRTDTRLVTGFVEDYNHKSYTKNPLRLLKALFKVNTESRSKCLKTAFCSELTSKMLMDMGVMDKGIAGNYIPKDFTSKKSITLTPGITLTPEFKVNKKKAFKE